MGVEHGRTARLELEPDILAAEAVCYLTTTGRVTGRPHRIEIWFALSGRTLYMLSGNRDNADWVKNALRDPRVSIEIEKSVFEARARITLENDAEDARARRLLYEKYSLTESDLEDWTRTSLSVAFDLMDPRLGGE
jgi:deazaflavin-dependent oxidoreductase (nitroreductase family)